MKIRIIIFCLITLAVAYKLVTRTSNTQTDAKIEQALILAETSGEDYQPDPLAGMDQEEEWEVVDSSDEELTALQYVQKYLEHGCSPTLGWELSCRFKNRSDREISKVTIEIRASSRWEDRFDDKKSQYEPYELEVIGPFPAGERSGSRVKLPADEELKFISERSTVLAAEY